MSLVTVTPLRPSRWLVMPMLICMAVTLVFATPLRVMGAAPPEPVFSLVLAFAWAAIRPSVLPPIALLTLGLFQDLVWGGRLGFWPLCLMSAYAVILLMRASLSGQGFLVQWAWYAAACGAAFGVGVVMTDLAAGVVPNLVGVFWQWLASAILFPLAWRMIERYEDADPRFR